MRKVKFFTLTYKNKKILLGYCNLNKFKWSCTKIDGQVILIVNKNYSLEDKRKIIHEALAECS